MQAKAAVLRGSGHPLEVQTVTVDDPGPGQVRVKLAACGICHTDQSVLQGVLPRAEPVVMGHEGAGVIESIGAGVTTLTPGDHVIMTTTAFCGRCPNCVEGMYAQCERMPLSVGGNYPFHFDGMDLMPFASVGGLCEYTVVAENTAIKIENDIPPGERLPARLWRHHGGGGRPSTPPRCGRARAAPSGAAAASGSVSSRAAALLAPRPSFRSTRTRRSSNSPESWAPPTSSTPPRRNAVEQVMALTGGRGADYTFEAIGVGSAMEQAYMAARRGGTATIVGVGRFDDTFSLSAGLFAITEKTLKGSFCGKGASVRDFPRMLDWYRAGMLDLDSLVTTTYPIEDVSQAFDDMTAGKNARGGGCLLTDLYA